MSDEETPKPRSPERARAVFSPEDFELIRTAISHYLKDLGDPSAAMKYSNLYHRLGRLM